MSPSDPSSTLRSSPLARPDRAWRLVAALLVVAPLAAGCTSAGGDPASAPSADDLGTGLRIHELLGPATWRNPANPNSVCPSTPTMPPCVPCVYPTNRKVYVSGVTVAAVDTFDETGDGKSAGTIYLEDTTTTPIPYSGVDVFGASFNPPALIVAPGDVVDLLGTDSEFIGPSSGVFSNCETLPEFTGAVAFRFDGQPVTPLTIQVSDLATYASARPYLGMLVRVENVTVTATSGGTKGRDEVPVQVGTGAGVLTVTNELYDLAKVGPVFTTGETFKSVTGIITYFYNFGIAPRSAADFEK